MMETTNPMRPYLGTLVGVKDLATDIRLFQVELNDSQARERFTYRPGQFAFLSASNLAKYPCFFLAPQIPYSLSYCGQYDTFLNCATNLLSSLAGQFAIDPDRVRRGHRHRRLPYIESLRKTRVAVVEGSRIHSPDSSGLAIVSGPQDACNTSGGSA